MIDFTERIAARLTDEDRKMLSAIYEPTVVAVPDKDPGFRLLTVTKDGAIRFYADYGQKNVFERPEMRCYLESTDAGLSWKRHLVPDSNTLGNGKYIPFLDKYLTFRYRWKQNTLALLGDSPDDPAPEAYDVGAALIESTDVLPLRTRNRILIVDHETRPDRHPTAYYPVLLITDDGKNYRRISLPEVPYAEKKWPEKGYRWQQNNRECTMCELSDGRILLISRTATDFHYYSVSCDGGETWSEFAPTVFHSTGTMPRLLRLSDGRILFFWCNTQLLPELPEANGEWEDFFTNRDANHAAISEDDGKTFFGFREMMLNPVRNNADFRSVGGTEHDRDKSVHQFEAIELPMNKILVVCGQHSVARRILIFDLNWLYEKERKEDFIHGLASLSTHTYVKSYSGGYGVRRSEDALTVAGHCAYNRTDGALLLPNPSGGRREVLFLERKDDPHLVSGIGGAVWNFPIARKGVIRLSAYLPGQGLRVSLLDCWRNPCDDTVEYRADASVVLRRDMQGDDEYFTEFVLRFDCDTDRFTVDAGEYFHREGRMNNAHPAGLCYLHLQSAATAPDPVGSYVAEFSFRAE